MYTTMRILASLGLAIATVCSFTLLVEVPAYGYGYIHFGFQIWTVLLAFLSGLMWAYAKAYPNKSEDWT